MFLVGKDLTDCDMLAIGAPEAVPFNILDIQDADFDYAITIQVPESDDILSESFSKMVILFAD